MSKTASQHMKAKGTYNRKYLRLAWAFYPIAGIIGYLFPSVFRKRINQAICKLAGFRGGIDKLNISPFSIKISIENLYMDKLDKGTTQMVRLIDAELIEIEIDRSKLWSGTVAGTVRIVSPVFSLSKRVMAGVQVKSGNPLVGFDPGMDIVIRSFDLTNGKIRFMDTTVNPVMEIEAKNINLSLAGFVIAPGAVEPVHADLRLQGDIYGGHLTASMQADLLSATPDFDIDVALAHVDMRQLNDIFSAFGRFDVSSGVLTMHSEASARMGRFKGYVEPTIDNLHILGPEDKKDGILRYLWEAMVGAAIEVLKDHSTDQLTARVTFDESFKKPDVHIGWALLEVMGNAFVHGLTPYMRNRVKIDL